MTDKKEIVRRLIAEARAFKLCGPSDDPDEQTAVTSGYHYLVVQFKRLAGPMLPEPFATRLDSIDIDMNDIYSAYAAKAELDALLPEIESAMEASDRHAPQPFSRRYGYRTPPNITIREDAPENLRHFVLDAALQAGHSSSSIREEACSVLHVRPNPNNWSDSNVWGEAQDLVYGCEWFKFYDIVEALYRHIPNRTAESFEGRVAQFRDALNEFFIDEGIGWQMQDGQIVVRGTDAFESNVRTATDALGAAGRTTARDELREAVGDLSRRPDPDLTGAVHHSMAALECVVRDVCGDENATLGEIIKRYPGVIPKPLDAAVEKAWGYASEMARHIREGQKPEHKDVEFIVSFAATVATYLSR